MFVILRCRIHPHTSEALGKDNVIRSQTDNTVSPSCISDHQHDQKPAPHPDTENIRWWRVLEKAAPGAAVTGSLLSASR